MTVNKIIQFAIQESYLCNGLGDDVVICKVVKVLAEHAAFIFRIDTKH
jgi:hypothetical protein